MRNLPFLTLQMYYRYLRLSGCEYANVTGCLRHQFCVDLLFMKHTKHISIVVPAGDAILSSIIGPYKTFSTANAYMMQTGRATVPPFTIQFVGVSDETRLYDGVFNVKPNAIIDSVKKTDLIIIPALNVDFGLEVARNAPFIPWITEQYTQGAEVASLCTGAFVLASTGLLDGKKCTTHWLAADSFRHIFPKAHLMTERIVTDEKGIYTSGGAYSFLNLMLYLIEKYAGREVAIYVSKVLEVDIDRKSQLTFVIFDKQKNHQDDLVKEAQHFIENNFTDKITIEQLSDKFAISRRNFERRFKKASGNSPVEYIQRVKIEAAKKSLESTRENINEVMYAVGYSDSKAFRTVFKKHTGLSPTEYKLKYNREMAMA